MTLPEPELDAEARHAFERGVAQFNTGYFFECHDTLEEVWGGVRGPARDFLQGLIQVSVGCYHLTGGNAVGAQSMFERALKRLAKYPDVYWGFDLAAHRREVEAWLARLRAGAAEPSLEQLPKWSFAWLPLPPGA